MKILLVRPGRFKESATKEITAVWLGHASRYARIELIETTAHSRKKTRDAAHRKEAEAALLLGAVPPGAILVAADSQGKLVDSPWFATCIDGARTLSRDLVFMVGGASGLTDALRTRADHLIAFGRITLNHDLAAVVLAEQIWRGLAILHNHPYHRAHE